VPVGNLQTPLAHPVPVLIREWGRDLQVRWQVPAGEVNELTLEFLVFAEGRFLTIHPSRYFNGRTIRLFLAELMRRLDFPGVVLGPEGEAERADYFLALEAADQFDWRPLTEIWRARFGV
jgi:CRISPR-associated endonuclease/helicase Cas3